MKVKNNQRLIKKTKTIKPIIDKSPPILDINQESKFINNYTLGLGVLGLGGLGYLGSKYLTKKNLPNQKKFEENIGLLKLKYPNQTSYFWKKIESNFYFSIVKKGDTSIILIVSDPSTSQLSYNLSNDILNAIKTSFNGLENIDLNSLIINPSDYKHFFQQKNYNKIKSLIDEKLVNIFSNDQHVALIKSIQEIPATSMLLFYTYGDDKTASDFFGNLIFMTLEINENLEKEKRDIFNKNNKDLIKFTEKYLFDLWSNDIYDDQLYPLFSRICNNVIMLNNEKK